MLVTVNTGLVCCNTYSYLKFSNRNGIKPYVNPPTPAKKNDISKNSSYKANKPLSQLKFSSSKNSLIQSAVGIFALGFVDAGYSGDWSRIGVISREVEDLLKAAVFLVVPFCIYVIFSLSRKVSEE